MGRYTGRSFRLLVMTAVSFLLFAMELAVAYVGNSLSLASDAVAVLSHLISMIIGFFGVRVSRVRWHRRNTFGFPRADVLGAFGNSVFATALMFSILVEALKRYINPQKTDNVLLVLGAGVTGLAVNILNYVIFLDCCPLAPPRPVSSLNAGDSLNTQHGPEQEIVKREKKSEALNIRGVLLHVMGDALGSVVVVIAATIFYVLPLDPSEPCNWECYIDPSLTILMVIIILSSAFPLIKETATILLQMVPKGVNVEELTIQLSQVPGISSIHDVHIWELASGKTIATLHVKCQKSRDYRDANFKMREIFHNAGIHSVTIQPEYLDPKEPTDPKDLVLFCSSPCISKACSSKLCCNQEMPLTQVNGYAEPNGDASRTGPWSGSLSRSDAAEITIEADWAGHLSDQGQALHKLQREKSPTKSTQF
ncbi:LOW QUALITY PROTEIN: zinc transporter 10 [Ornithorhynchus anatinus]|uniref:LOW QUALITY PROTEIN: zinc transporter 10 n=1 Tax=Ornithorhynchus anatinus TaxID=9258 RepID=UPI0019D4A861|nr:LOW QUALITY PROTEIN: zinc transporter 10 [Ornithorhynchus anatinus]